MKWLKEKNTKNGTALLIGPFLTPKMAIVSSVLFRLLVYTAGIWIFVRWWQTGRLKWTSRFLMDWTNSSYMAQYGPYIAIILWLLVLSFITQTSLSDRIALVFFGHRRKVTFTEKEVKVGFWKSGLCKRNKDIVSEIVTDPRARTAQRYKSFYQKSGIVVLRCGEKEPVIVATIYDTKNFGLGHKADQLVRALQDLLSRSPVEQSEIVSTHFYGGERTTS